MQLCYTSVEILSAQMVGAQRATIPESEAFRMRHEVLRVKKRDKGGNLPPRDLLDVDRSIPVTETEVEFWDL